MRQSIAPWLCLICCLMGLTGCRTARPAEDTVLCAAVTELFARSMEFQPLFSSVEGECRAVSEAALLVSGERRLFSDDQCSAALSYGGESWQTFCKNNVVGTDHTKNYIGNPDAWSNLDPSVTERKETLWSLSHGTNLHLATVNQTEGHKRPYLKRVEYRREGQCALGMQIYKNDPNATDLKPLIFIHGGGWKYRGLSAVVGIETAVPNLTDQGYVIFAPFYRLLEKSDGPAACQGADGKEILDDIDAAFEWVLANGESFGVNWGSEQKISVMGQSAGGHLAAYLATYRPKQVERGILLYPAPDLGFFAAGIRPGGLFQDGYDKSRGLLFAFFPQPGVSDPAELNLSDPQIRRNSFPDVVQPSPESYPELHMIHGDSDQTVPVELTTRFCQGLDPNEAPTAGAYPGGDLDRACGQNRTLTVVAGADHVLDLRCFTGSHGDVIRRLFPETAALCAAGSEEGARRVRESLEKAYSKF